MNHSQTNISQLFTIPSDFVSLLLNENAQDLRTNPIYIKSIENLIKCETNGRDLIRTAVYLLYQWLLTNKKIINMFAR